MDVERRLITKVIDTGDFDAVREAKLLPHFFRDKENREVYAWLIEYHAEHGETPTEAVLARHFPNYELESEAPEPLSYYITEVRLARHYSVLSGGVSSAGKALKDQDVVAAQRLLTDALARVNTEVSSLRDVDLTENWEERLERYESYAELGGALRGMATGYPSFDRALLGVQPEQFIVIAGPDKSGKSTLAMSIARYLHRYPASGMFVSFEMSQQEQEARWDAMQAELNWRKLMTGRLSGAEWRRLEQRMKELREFPPFTLSTDITAGATMGMLHQKIEHYKPKFIVVDGAYLMESETPAFETGSPQHLTELSRGMKRTAQKYGIAVIITTQVLRWKMSRRRGVTSESIGYTSAFAQDADIVIGVREDDDDPEVRETSIVTARNAAPRRGIMVSWDWEHSDFRELEDYEHVAGDEENSLSQAANSY